MIIIDIIAGLAILAAVIFGRMLFKNSKTNYLDRARLDRNAHKIKAEQARKERAGKAKAGAIDWTRSNGRWE